LGAGLAIVSVIPPVDAFTVSRNSQITRLEQMLTTEGVLTGGQNHTQSRRYHATAAGNHQHPQLPGNPQLPAVSGLAAGRFQDVR